MTPREDSKLRKLMRRKLNSNSAKSSEKQWDPTKFLTLLLMMEEPSDTPIQRSRSTIQSR